MKINFRFVVIFSCLPLSVFGQAGIQDTEFGNEGIVITDIFGYHDIARALAIQKDGKILAGGESFSGYDNDFCIARYNSDGTLDETFGNSGITTTNIGEDDDAYAIAIQPDGRILLAGESINDETTYIVIVRYTTGGNLDTTFGNSGILIPDIESDEGIATSMLVTDDNKIFVSGYIGSDLYQDFILMCFDVDGNPDNSFGTSGKVISDFGGDQGGLAMALQDDNKIVVGGWDLNSNSDFAILRYNENGSPDSSFNSDGYYVTPFTPNTDACRAIGIQNDGKIVAAGFRWEEEGNDFAMLQLNTNGSTDVTFGSSGKVTTDFQESDDQAYALAIQGDGKIILAGYSVSPNSHGYDFAVARYLPDGDLDTTFGEAGKVITSLGNYFEHAKAIVLQPDGKIVVAGDTYSDEYDFAIVRYLNDYTGIEDSVIQQTPNVSCFPNPFDDHFTLNVNDPGTEGGILKIFDLLGNEILIKQIDLTETEINLSGCANGVYLIRYESDFNISIDKIVKR